MTDLEFYQSRIQAAIDHDRAHSAEHGWEFKERTLDTSIIRDFITATLAIEQPDDMRRFYLGHKAHIQRQMDAGTWQGRDTAEQSARSDIGYCFGEGMSRETIRRWNEATAALHPTLGMAYDLTQDEILQRGIARGQRPAPVAEG